MGIPIFGIESKELYETIRRARKDSSIPFLELQNARNKVMAESALVSLSSHEFPILFVGGGHLTAYSVGQKRSLQLLKKYIDKKTYVQFQDIVPKGIRDYLKGWGVGYVFLQGFAHEGDDRYSKLFEVQEGSDTSAYVKEYAFKSIRNEALKGDLDALVKLAGMYEIASLIFTIR